MGQLVCLDSGLNTETAVTNLKSKGNRARVYVNERAGSLPLMFI